MKQPLITVLMTVYNGGSYLKRSVSDVLSQTLKDFEFLIINDCSTDKTAEVIESFNDPRIRLVTNEKNLGQTRSLNKGLRLARGNYVARIDADDGAFSHWLEEQARSVNEKPEHAVISANAVVVDEFDKIRKTSFVPSDLGEIKMRAIIRSPINHVGSVMKVENVLAVGGYDETFKLAADYDLWVKLLAAGQKITVTEKPLVSIRSHSQSASKRGRGSIDGAEIESIMGKAVGAFSSVAQDKDRLHWLCQAIYDEGSLGDREFGEAINYLKDIYLNLKSSVTADKSKIRAWVSGQERTAYLKRIHAKILDGDLDQVKWAARRGRKAFGSGSVFTLILAVASLGNPAARMIPKGYFLLQSLSAKFRMGLF